MGIASCFAEPASHDEGAIGSIGPTSSGGEHTGTIESTGVADASTGTGSGQTSGADATFGTKGTESVGTSVDTTGDSVASSTGEVVLGIADLAYGDLVITEVMWNPNCGADVCEWIEILNATDSPVDLLDLRVWDNDMDAASQGRITRNVLVAPGEYAVIAKSLAGWPYSFDPAAVYGPNPNFNNAEPDRALLVNQDGIVIDTIASFFEGAEGATWSLSPLALDAVSNDIAANWCPATTELMSTLGPEFGTPGELNADC